MALAFRAASGFGGTNNGTAYSFATPAGVADGDLLIAFACHDGGAPTISSSGWTTIVSAYAFTVVAYKIWHTGDSTTIAFADTGGNWWMGGCAAYSGADTTNPIDDYTDWSIGTGGGAGADPAEVLYRAPALVPSYQNEIMFVIFTDHFNVGGGSWTVPTGFTNRGSSTFGPNAMFCEKALTTGADTGNADASGRGEQSGKFGCSILIRPAAASTASHSASVSEGGIDRVNAGTSTGLALALNLIGVKNNDLVVVIIVSAGTVTPPSGYTLQGSVAGMALYTHKWLTGDATAPAWSSTVNNMHAYAFLLRTKGGAGPPVFDTIGTGSGTTSATAPSVTPAQTNEFLGVAFDDSNASGGTWPTPPTGLTIDESRTTGPDLIFGWQRGVSSASGTFSATGTTGRTIGAMTFLVAPQAAAAPSAAKQAAVSVMS